MPKNKPAELPPHPMQPVYRDEEGVIRFRRNEIIDWLFMTGKLNLNEIVPLTHKGAFPVADMEQLYQLLGYSLSGYGELQLPRPESVEAADAAAEKLRG